MRKTALLLLNAFLLTGIIGFAQNRNKEVADAIVKEATENSQLEKLAHELMDGIGPRLVATTSTTSRQ